MSTFTLLLLCALGVSAYPSQTFALENQKCIALPENPTSPFPYEETSSAGVFSHMARYLGYLPTPKYMLLRDDFDSYISNVDRFVFTASDTVAQLNEDIGDLKDDLDIVQQRRQYAESEIKIQQKNITALITEIRDLKASLNTANKTIIDLGITLRKSEDENKAINEHNSDLERKITNLTHSNDSAKNEINDLKIALLQTEDNLLLEQKNTTDLTLQIHELELSLKNAEEGREKDRDKLIDLKHSLLQTEEKLKAANLKIQSLQTTVIHRILNRVEVCIETAKSIISSFLRIISSVLRIIASFALNVYMKIVNRYIALLVEVRLNRDQSAALEQVKTAARRECAQKIKEVKQKSDHAQNTALEEQRTLLGNECASEINKVKAAAVRISDLWSVLLSISGLVFGIFIGKKWKNRIPEAIRTLEMAEVPVSEVVRTVEVPVSESVRTVEVPVSESVRTVEVALPTVNVLPQIRNKGIVNLGNTCYMNAIIQILIHLPELTEYFFTERFLNDVKYTNYLGYSGKLAGSFSRLLTEFIKKPSVVPSEFVNCVLTLNPLFADGRQHDAQEFLAFLLGGLDEELKRMKELSFVLSLFQGTFRNSMLCNCGYVYKITNSSLIYRFDSTRLEPFALLSLPLPKKSRRFPVKLLELINVFTTKEQMQAADWKCPNCKEFTAPEKFVNLFSFPEILIIQLKRFEFVSMFAGPTKIHTVVDFPEKLELGEFAVGEDTREITYRLIGLVFHLGESEFGALHCLFQHYRRLAMF